MFFSYPQPAEGTGHNDKVPESPDVATADANQHPRTPKTTMPGGLVQTQSSVDNNAAVAEDGSYDQERCLDGPWNTADEQAHVFPTSPPGASKGIVVLSPRTYVDGDIVGEEGNGLSDALSPNGGPVQGDSILLVEAKTDAEVAQDVLTAKEKSKLAKNEGEFSPMMLVENHASNLVETAKTNKKLTEALKAESKISKMTLSLALKQLSEAQASQKSVVSEERKAHAARAKAISACAKAEAAYREAKTRWEKQKVEVASKEDALGAAKTGAAEANKRVEAAMTLADRLRKDNMVDEVRTCFEEKRKIKFDITQHPQRERGIKQAELSGRAVSGRRSLYFGSFGGKAF
jgi:hypothetical protein